MRTLGVNHYKVKTQNKHHFIVIESKDMQYVVLTKAIQTKLYHQLNNKLSNLKTE